MPAGQDLIFFDNSADWQVVVDRTFRARLAGENSHVPITPQDLGVSLDAPYIAVLVLTEEAKPSWYFAGDIRQVYDFASGGIGTALGRVQTEPNRLALGKLQVIDTGRISPDNYRLRYQPPYWFKNAAIRVYSYVGDTLNFVEDTLFSIGNALGIDPNSPSGLIEAQLTVIEELITDKFRELSERQESQVQLDDFREQQLNNRMNQANAGIYTLAEGLASLLPEGQAEALRQVTQYRLQLDLGYL